MRHSLFSSAASRSLHQLRTHCIVLLALATVLSSCDKKEPTAPVANAPPVPTTTATPPATAAQPDPDMALEAEVAAVPLAATSTTWTPEQLENLLAPIALYPDPVLLQVLMASTNPQEVLDSGNWLLKNNSLKGDELTTAGQKMGFTPPVLALIQFPRVVDMMCQDLDWTSELGQAYVNDQAGVLDAAQRLRVQAKDVGTLQDSEQMKVETVTQGEQEVVMISSPNPEVVYVPQYDPVAAYAPPPAAPAAPATTQTTIVEDDDDDDDDDDDGYSTGAMVTTGVLSFGAGILVSELLEDDDDDYYGGGYWGAPPPYYPPYPYRPPYGNGFYPSHGYDRRGGNFSNNNVIINQDNNYWQNRQRGNDRSPISDARPNRPELQNLNSQAAQGPRRAAPSRDQTYAGTRPGDAGRAGQSNRPGATQGNLSAPARQPKVQGSYAGARPGGAQTSRAAAARSMQTPSGSYAGARPDAQRPGQTALNRNSSISPSTGVVRPSQPPGITDRGRSFPTARPSAQTRQTMPSRQPDMNRSFGSRTSAISGSNRGRADRMASERGRQSMRGDAGRSRGGGGGRGGRGGRGR